MKVLLTGLNHRTAPVEVRERMALSGEALQQSLGHLRGRAGIDEVLILATCNRVEVTFTAGGDEAEARREVLALLAGTGGVDPAWLESYLYHFEDREAVRHLFRVASSLDSMVLGEPQILGQLKAAYAAARDSGSIQGFLDSVVTRAFSVAKRVRSETEIGRSAVSVSYAAIELARQIFGDLDKKRALLLGAGKMSELAARHLHRAGCEQILVANRTRSRADEMAALVNGQVIDYETFHARLPDVDILLASSGAPGYLVGKEEMRQVLRKRQNRPVLILDIAVPRNIDPAVNDLENAYLYDIDDLGREVEENRRARLKEAEGAEEIIAAEIERLFERLRAREVAPTIVSLQQRLDELGQSETERLRSRFGALTPQQEEALAQLTRGLLNKIAHGPLTELRRAAGGQDGDRTIAIIRRIFRLDE